MYAYIYTYIKCTREHDRLFLDFTVVKHDTLDGTFVQLETFA